MEFEIMGSILGGVLLADYSMGLAVPSDSIKKYLQ